MKKYRVNVNGTVFEVEIEEMTVRPPLLRLLRLPPLHLPPPPEAKRSPPPCPAPF